VEEALYGRHLHYIRVSDERAILKRGTSELLLSGERVHALLEPLLPLLEEGRTRQQIVESYPEGDRGEIDELLGGLLRRRLIAEDPQPDAVEAGLESLEAAFWWNFGETARQTPERLRQARIVVTGANFISRALIRSLLESGVGRVTLVDHAALNNEVASLDLNAGEHQKLSRVPELPARADLAGASLLCATSDFGQTDALLEINRAALNAGKPFLPVWLDDLRGYVGPLNYPYESACLRCYRARVESNHSDYQAARAVRQHISENPQARANAGFLPAMPAILGEIAAVEMTKFISGFPPCDTVGRIIEINLVSFASIVRRVLKLPRCPDCSEMMRKATRAITLGPLIPHSE
jgi:bacteriocin biosynthesis cyclodehydratase domain-containing protein